MKAAKDVKDVKDHPRPKSIHDGLQGLSTRIHEEDMTRFRAMMAVLKESHGKGFSLADLLRAVTFMDIEFLKKEITRYELSRAATPSFIRRLDISAEAKERIKAILHEEKNK